MNRYALVLAQYLLRRRTELNLTIDEAAERAAITRDEWSSFERGSVPPQTGRTIDALGDALEASPVGIWLLTCIAEYNQSR